MSERTAHPDHREPSSGPDIQVTSPSANTDAEVNDVNPELHQSATDDLSDPDERPQVDEEIARGRKNTGA